MPRPRRPLAPLGRRTAARSVIRPLSGGVAPAPRAEPVCVRARASQAVEILEAHFGEEEDEDENLAPDVSGGGFSFGNMAAQLAAAAAAQPLLSE